MNLKRLSQSASPLLGLLLFGVSLWAICNQLREYHYRDVLRSLTPMSYPSFFGIYLLAQIAGLISNVPSC